MSKEFKSKDLFTIPNILTFIRILLITPFVEFFLEKDFISAAIVLGLSGLSDCLDGVIARKFNQITELGKVLDPIADKLTLLAIVICFAIYMPVITPIMLILAVKDFLMLIAGTNLIKKGITPPAAKWYGKVGTIFFYFSTCLIIFLKAFLNYENFVLTFMLLSITAILMIFAFVKYGKIYLQLIKKYKQEKELSSKE